ncbi:MAG: bifunctional (p)ppGpp synthetase/guanosine-3',5'-bis(diphosphate) 3'-pyrophosphohydrolase [Burkholderiales bacterium]|nr:bifunctional (p)ppGpp synthetase/guanosine-3',5'-bis(diphosphate) 3'-pyrophosphohydrolase [Burkholderiales bacterium]
MPSNDLLRQLGQYLPPDEVALVERAYLYSERAHAGQLRKSGEPYVTHPLAVASILAGWQLDAQALAAALLHDVLEDTAISKEELARKFDSVIADLVDAVSKLNQLDFSSREEAQAETFSKMVLAMARDVRVILIKLADRFHNMQTLGAMSLASRQRIARETRDIYAPIAQRLGLYTLRQSLLDLSFKHLYPYRHRMLSNAIETVRAGRRDTVDGVLSLLRERLAQEPQLNAEVSARERTVYSAYNKMREKHIRLQQVMESYGVLVLLDSRSACYTVLGILHEIYKPLPGRFKDYIAIPKANGYQALHTTLFGPSSIPIDVQIRTRDMNLVAEVGVAAHWMYSSASDLVHLAETQQSTRRWLKGLLEMQTEGDSREFVENIKRDFFPEEIYVFTPKGRIMVLPRGATVIDFAYSIHTDVGNHCVGAKIDHEIMPLRTVLKNGSQVEVLTDANAQPMPAWLSFVTTGKARSAIRNYLKNQQQQASAALGERLLGHALTIFKLDAKKIAPEQWQAFSEIQGAKSATELFTDIGRGKRLPFMVAQTFAQQRNGGQPLPEQRRGKRLPFAQTFARWFDQPSTEQLQLRDGDGDVLCYASCCRPLPNDPIVGWFRPGQELEVHIRDCATLKQHAVRQGEWIEMAWPDKPQALFVSEVRSWALDRQGLLADQASAIAQAGANILQVTIEKPQGHAPSAMQFQIEVRDRQHLADILRGLRRVAGVKKVQRARA